MLQKFIVAEITKSWDRATPVNNIISQQFEAVINTNMSRGYKLIDWRFNVFANNGHVSETIVAIFELVESDPKVKP